MAVESNMKDRIRHQGRALARLLTIAAATASTIALGEAHRGEQRIEVMAPTTWSSQSLYCQSSYQTTVCEKELEALRDALRQFPVDRLGSWNWVLIRSEEWRTLAGSLWLDPRSPAFTSLQDRATFLNEALISPDARYQAELIAAYRVPMHRLLHVAIAHELGHALCGVVDEGKAARLGERLSAGEAPECAAAVAP